jgi:hypothetical protein
MAGTQNNWLGATTAGDFNVAANFSDGATPSAGDDLKFLAENTSVAGPTANPAASAAILLNMFYVGPGYTQTMGGSGAHIQISSEFVHYQGTSGKLWLKEGTNAGGTASVVCDSSSSSPLLHDCLQLTDTLFDRLAVIRGWCTLESSCAVTDITLGSRNSNTVESKLTINTGATAPGSVTVHQGIGSCLVNATKLVMFGGTWTQESGGAVITTIEMWGGNLILKTGGTFANVRHFGGTIDATQGGGLHTFTNYFRMPGAVLLGEGNASLVALPTTQPALAYVS